MGPALARLGDVPALRTAGPRQPVRGARIPISPFHHRVLPAIHLHRTDRQDHLPEPLLLGKPGQFPDDLHAPQPGVVAGRPAQSVPPAGRNDAGMGHLDIGGAGGSRIPLRRDRQAEPRLAAARPAAANLAIQQQRPAVGRATAERGLGRICDELVGGRLRPHDRRLAVVAAQQAVRLRGPGGFSRDHLAAVSDRDVPLDHDGGRVGVLPSGLATPAAFNGPETALRGALF